MPPAPATLFLTAILAASWQGTLVMLLILSLRPLLGRRVPARWRYLLWTFVLVRLLVPSFILPPSPASLQNISVVERPAERVTIAFDKAYTDYAMGGAFGVQEPSAAVSAVAERLPAFHPLAGYHQGSWWRIGTMIWAAGATVLTAWILGAALRLRRRMRREAVPVSEAVAATWVSCCARISLACPPRLLAVRWIGSPALVGVFQPTLLIPEKAMETFSREDWEHILMHELAHYRRRDHWTHALQLVALCVHWFNPLVWMGFRFFRADRELAADELALRSLAGGRAVAYGDTLLKVLSTHSTTGFQAGMIGIMDDCAQLKQRLRRIVAFGPSHIIGSVAGFGLILVLSLVVLGRASNTADLSAYGDLQPAEMLVSAAAKNDLPVLRKLLDENIDINSAANLPGEKTALAAAAAANQMEVVRFLVTRGARVNSQEGGPSPALLAALRNGGTECADYLLAKGASCDPQILADAKADMARLKAGAYLVLSPAERGRILDRNGKVLATNRLTRNLGIVFPSLRLTDSDAIAFARQQIARVEGMIPRSLNLSISDKEILRHYKNRGMLPLDIVSDLTEEEQASLKQGAGPELAVHSAALRYYPNGSLGAHILGFTGLRDPARDEPIRANKVGPIETAGRDGLEATFNDQLAGKPGNTLFTFDAQGHKISERISFAPEPGDNVVTTIDANVQSLCENVLEQRARPGAIVIIDPNNGDVLAMASWPAFDPNLFIPAISVEKFKALLADPGHPLMDRAYGASYPPGSTFKMFTGLAALEGGVIKFDEKIANPPFIQIGDHAFKDWKNADRGMLDFADALDQNADTWFYQVGIKTGPQPIVDLALKFGFSKKTGIPLPGEKMGLIPTDQWLKENGYKDWAGLSSGHVINLAIGEGFVLVTPLQMAQAMAVIANGGTFYQTRLVARLQNHDGTIIGEYKLQRRDQVALKPEILAELKKAMVAAVNGDRGMGHGAFLDGIQVAGHSGAAQMQIEGKARTAGWFAGFAPADRPKYAIVAFDEGNPDGLASSDGNAALMVGKVLRELLSAHAARQDGPLKR
jgi:penicillin-binding protein 2